MPSPKIQPLASPFPGANASSQESLHIDRTVTQLATARNPFGIPEEKPPATQPKRVDGINSPTTPPLHREGAFHANLVPRENQ